MGIEISVIIPTYNRLKDIDDTLESLKAQSYSSDKFEVVVIDGGTSGVNELVEKYKDLKHFNFILNAERGASVQRNVGIENAKGTYLAFIDDDANAEPGWLSSFAAFFEKNDFGVLAGKIVPLWSDAAKNWHKSSPYVRNLYSMYDLGNQSKEVEYGFSCNYLMPKSVLIEFGGFDPSHGRIGDERILYGEDVIICQKINTKYKNYYIPEAVVHHKVLDYRLKYCWLAQRAFAGGLTKGLQNRKPKPHQKMKLTLMDYTLLVPYALGLLKGHLSRLLN